MELGSVVKFLEGKTILVTGATGFLAKSTLSSYLFVCSIIFCLAKNVGHRSDLFVDRNAVFVEKVLRVQPNVKKLYLLLRASDAKAATLRFQNEVCCKRLITNKLYM